MFFCPGSIGLLNDDDEHNWGDIDNFYNHPSYLTFHHHGGDHDNKFSKMGSLMFVSCRANNQKRCERDRLRFLFKQAKNEEEEDGMLTSFVSGLLLLCIFYN
ncbi:hypothetical protein OUZ56_014874 [Daphnia magna]|uniref:Uncharacterized protein n=1 Tax=Daphnia magna TaxID=35525 RepID=A0ABR0ALH6_9CRUS|nr:hypothetical protein OUZ56_014874 [Daphnia magna]